MSRVTKAIGINFRIVKGIASALFLAMFVLLLLYPQAILPFVIVALPALIPPLRERARSNSKFRMRLMVILGLIPFVVVYIYLIDAFTGAGPFSPYRFAPFENCYSGELLTSETPEDLIFRELWVRNLVPPPFSNLCFMGEDVCSYLECVDTETGSGLVHYNNWWRYLTVISYAVAPALITAFFVGMFTRSSNSSFVRALFFWEFGEEASGSDE